MNRTAGIYNVKLDLGGTGLRMSGDQLSAFRSKLNEMGEQEPALWDICSLEGETLRYQSETIYPSLKNNKRRQRVLLVFGNPAIHSVKQGMFFYSRSDGARHGMWGKLAKADLVGRVKEGSREEEAELRRQRIMSGTSSRRYWVGLTTFYSFPTPAADRAKFSGVEGVEELFRPVLDNLRKIELNRILRYSFTKDAILVFTQTSSCEWFNRHSGREALHWPIRGKGSGGNILGALIRKTAIKIIQDRQ